MWGALVVGLGVKFEDAISWRASELIKIDWEV